jgi:hypothetical protein
VKEKLQWIKIDFLPRNSQRKTLWGNHRHRTASRRIASHQIRRHPAIAGYSRGKRAMGNRVSDNVTPENNNNNKRSKEP